MVGLCESVDDHRSADQVLNGGACHRSGSLNALLAPMLEKGKPTGGKLHVLFSGIFRAMVTDGPWNRQAILTHQVVYRRMESK